MYHPEDDDPAGEYIELYNRGGDAVDLSGWCIDGITFCFGGGTSIAGNGFVVTTSSDWEGAASNGGEDLTLFDAAGNEIDFVEYDDKNKWPANTDGNGASLQRLDVSADADNPGNWTGEAPTPGRRNASISQPDRSGTTSSTPCFPHLVTRS